MSYSVAIDGPAGAGKSTIAKMVSGKLGFIYVDTGALYRAIAYDFLENTISLDNKEQVSARLRAIDVSLKYREGKQYVILNGKDVSTEIRKENIGNMASKASAHKEVREKLLSLQRDIAKDNDVVMDGRDIGTMVLPGADLKIYLTASVGVRAMRRYSELIEKGESADLEVIKEDIKNRDERDMNREIAPLKQADDAILVDSSNMSIEEVVDKIISFVKVR